MKFKKINNLISRIYYTKNSQDDEIREGRKVLKSFKNKNKNKIRIKNIVQD